MSAGNMMPLWVLVNIMMALTSYTVMPASLSQTQSPGYRAAVYAHKLVLPTGLPVSRAMAVEDMMKNVDIYREQARLAASQGAQIIVFPEDGLYGIGLHRSVIRAYLEPVPDPRTTAPWVPCSDPHRVTPSDILTQLSCIARNNSIYLTANMGGIQPCDDVTMLCPPDGHYQYNTDVVFDPTGQLIARYHKHTMFDEAEFDTAPAELVTFDTPFGRFGVFTCFDILFHDPAVVLAEQGVHNIVFPTAWIDTYPLLDAVGFHSGWARAHALTLLAANIQLPASHFVGSGVYSSAGALAFYYNHTTDSPGHLLLVDVPGMTSSRNLRSTNLHVVDDDHCPDCADVGNPDGDDVGNPDGADVGDPADVGSRNVADAVVPRRFLTKQSVSLKTTEPGHSLNKQTLPSPHAAALFENTLHHQRFQMVGVNEASGTVSVCKGKMCCTLSYVRPPASLNHDYFALGVNEGVRHLNFTKAVDKAVPHSAKDWYYQTCMLVRCTDRSQSSCGHPTWDSETVFSSIVLSGNFTTKYVYPEVLVSVNSQIALTPPEEWQFSEGGTLTATRLSQPLLTAVLYARDYTKDP